MTSRESICKLAVVILANALAGCAFEQVAWAQKAPSAQPAPAALAEKGIDLAQRDACDQALPLLNQALASPGDKHLVYAAAMAKARCGMSLNDMPVAVEALVLLNRRFPDDPQVLFVTTHYFSELALRASHRLASKDPSSRQAIELEAEALQSQGNTSEAAKLYRLILTKDPEAPGVHYQLGRLLMLQKPPTPAAADEATKEFEEELKINPQSAAAEFMLGDIAWRGQNWDQAVLHFSRATQDDPKFAEAFIGLGMVLNGEKKYSQAIPVLQKYVSMQPDDTAGYYQLSVAYQRLGRTEDAARERALQWKAFNKQQNKNSGVQISGGIH